MRFGVNLPGPFRISLGGRRRRRSRGRSPIYARRPHRPARHPRYRWGRLVGWARRHPVRAGGLSVVVVGIVVAVVLAGGGSAATSAGGAPRGPGGVAAASREAAPTTTESPTGRSAPDRGTSRTSGVERAPSATNPVEPGSGYYRLVQYPDAGFTGYYGQIRRATRSIDIEMYELADTTAEHLLADAAARHVRVDVLLDADYHGGEVNRAAFGYLAAHGVSVRWAPRGVIFHIKMSLFDGATVDISTANLTSKYYSDTRDAEIVDTNPRQVAAALTTFEHDFAAGSGGDPAGDAAAATGLVWSPDTGSRTAQAVLAGQISRAEHSIAVESEEMSDPTVVGALAADARRGVACEVVMTASSSWDSAFRDLAAAGCRVRVFPDVTSALYIHEKLIVADAGHPDASILLGSQNLSTASLTRDRELGVTVTAAEGAASVITAAARTFRDDFDRARPWAAYPADHRGPSATPAPVDGTPAIGSSAASGASAGCRPRAADGNCYKPGEYCPHADDGTSGVDGTGQAIRCRYVDGWRWEPA